MGLPLNEEVPYLISCAHNFIEKSELTGAVINTPISVIFKFSQTDNDEHNISNELSNKEKYYIECKVSEIAIYPPYIRAKDGTGRNDFAIARLEGFLAN
jgi:hypothetical protein